MNVWVFLKSQFQLFFYIMRTTTLPFGARDFSLFDLTVTVSIIAVIGCYFGFDKDEDDL